MVSRDANGLQDRIVDYSLLVKDGLLTDDEVSMINNPNSEAARKFFYDAFKKEADRKQIKTGPRDELILAVVQNMTDNDPLRKKMFDCYGARPEFKKHYNDLQNEWRNEELALLEKEIAEKFEQAKSGFAGYGEEIDLKYLIREVKESCLIHDMKLHKNPERFRRWYVMEFPERVHPRCLPGTGETCGRSACLILARAKREDAARQAG